MRECANLVHGDTAGHVYLAHHSLFQFLFESDVWAKFTTVRLELGELCVKHLAGPDYNLTLTCGASHAQRIDSHFNAATFLGLAIPTYQRLPLFRNTLTSSAAIITPPLRMPEPNVPERPRLFSYAKANWLLLTTDLTGGSVNSTSVVFRKLALTPSSRSYGLHPWGFNLSIDSHYSHLLGWAIAHSHVPLLRALDQAATPKPKKEIYDLPLHEYDDYLPIHLAARTTPSINLLQNQKSDAEIVFSMIWNRCRHEARDNAKLTVLHHAVAVDNVAVLPHIIKSDDLDLDSRDRLLRTALVVAIQCESAASLSVLINAGARIDIPYNSVNIAKSVHPLMAAARVGGLAAFELILGRMDPKDIHARDSLGRTALHYAALSATQTTGLIMQQLLSAGASHDQLDEANKTPLETACEQQNINAARSLIRHYNASALEASMELLGTVLPQGKTLFIAGALEDPKNFLLNGRGCKMVEHLISTNEKMLTLHQEFLGTTECDDRGANLLMLAVEADCPVLLRQVIAKGSIDRRQQDHLGRTGLHYALADNSKFRVAEILLSDEKVPELDIPDRDGRTPFSMMLPHHVGSSIYNDIWQKLAFRERLDLAECIIAKPEIIRGKSLAEIGKLYTETARAIEFLQALNPNFKQTHIHMKWQLSPEETEQLHAGILLPEFSFALENAFEQFQMDEWARQRIYCPADDPPRETISYRFYHSPDPQKKHMGALMMRVDGRLKFVICLVLVPHGGHGAGSSSLC